MAQLAIQNLSNPAPLEGALKFATQISPLINFFGKCPLSGPDIFCIIDLL